MRRKDLITNKYFEWMFDLVCKDRYASSISFRKLLMHLHNTEFTYCLGNDKNRAEDGISLRYRFAYENPEFDDAEAYLDGPCSVLEMMLALSIRCEESIMDNPVIGDRTAHWFWGMVTNLGLGSMYDAKYDRRIVDAILTRFLNRDYEPNGKGGLFTIRNRNTDLRTVEIWYQLNWFLDSIS